MEPEIILNRYYGNDDGFNTFIREPCMEIHILYRSK